MKASAAILVAAAAVLTACGSTQQQPAVTVTVRAIPVGGDQQKCRQAVEQQIRHVVSHSIQESNDIVVKAEADADAVNLARYCSGIDRYVDEEIMASVRNQYRKQLSDYYHGKTPEPVVTPS